MPKLSLPLLQGAKQTDLDYRDLLPVNMMPVIRNIKGDQGYLLTVDGLESFADTNGVARGGYYNERFKKHFRVSGDKLESIGTDGSVEVLGVIPGNDICKFASSFNTQAILSEGRLFLYDNATLRELSSPNLGFPIDIAQFRGIYVLTDGENVYQTDITDEFSVSPLKFVTSEFSNDPTVAVRQTENNQIIAFNTTSIEYFYFDPSNDVSVSVLSPIQGKSTKVGVAGANCIAEMDGAYFCIGARPGEEFETFGLAAGGRAQQISTRHINQILKGRSRTELSKVFIESRYSDSQHVLLIHLSDCTLAYSHTIAKSAGLGGAWSVLKSGKDNDIYRAKFGVFDPRISKWVYGDILENKLGTLSKDTASQYDEPAECECYTPINYLDGNIVLQNVTFQTIPGFSEVDTKLIYSFTDNGVTFGNESSFIISEQQRYKKEINIRSGGMFTELMGMKIRFVSNSKQAISGCVIEYRARATS